MRRLRSALLAALCADNFGHSASLTIQLGAIDATGEGAIDGLGSDEAKELECAETCAKIGMEPLYGSRFASGNPHLKDIGGNIVSMEQIGTYTLLAYPRDEKQTSSLRVDATIKHRGNSSGCHGYFIHMLEVTGTLVGEAIRFSTRGSVPADASALEVQVGDRSVHDPEAVRALRPAGNYTLTYDDTRSQLPRRMHHRYRFAALTLAAGGAKLEIDWNTDPRGKMNSLDFHGRQLGKLGSTWGGLLGSGGHQGAPARDASCDRSVVDFGRVASLFATDARGDAGGDEWWAEASLD
mmetsp:Transcript_48609/g.137425  ORF Transcript_48609/g.137425 Transcript_48609/m.137425 type:complete len:295 (-) Transcript_48609:42-926(-)